MSSPASWHARWPALQGGVLAVAAAILFGISTPLVQRAGAGGQRELPVVVDPEDGAGGVAGGEGLAQRVLVAGPPSFAFGAGEAGRALDAQLQLA